jgi:hypothetical protein
VWGGNMTAMPALLNRRQGSIPGASITQQYRPALVIELDITFVRRQIFTAI